MIDIEKMIAETPKGVDGAQVHSFVQVLREDMMRLDGRMKAMEAKMDKILKLLNKEGK